MKQSFLLLFLLIVLILSNHANAQSVKYKGIIDSLNNELATNPLHLRFYAGIKIVNLEENKDTTTRLLHKYNLVFNKRLGANYLRTENIKFINDYYRKRLSYLFKKDNFQIYCEVFKLESMVPNLYVTDKATIDSSKLNFTPTSRTPFLSYPDNKGDFSNGLLGRNIVLSPSHGFYYNNQAKKWMWQRPGLFQTVEDLLPISFILPFVAPMIENAGANTFIPRERDISKNEVVYSNEGFSFSKVIQDNSIAEPIQIPFYSNSVFDPSHPLKLDKYYKLKTSLQHSAQLTYTPKIAEDGDYSVYVAWAPEQNKSNVKDAHFIIKHAGGSTNIVVNQQIGGTVWQYLGRFSFLKGQNPELGAVILTNESNNSNDSSYVSLLSVKIGGGMGNVAREDLVSDRPRYTEAGRYFLEYSNYNDTLVYNLGEGKDDFPDDYRSRGEFANYLNGAPIGPSRYYNIAGLGIPIDFMLSFHTDAGITQNDTTIGTLLIYCTTDYDSLRVFHSGESRLTNRDAADIMSSEITKAIRAEFDKEWSQRDLRDERYSEASRPNIPSVLLELLSHQNFADMKFAHDPNFKFTVSRAIYKSILKYIANRNSIPFVVQPLPVDKFSTEITNEKILLNWSAVKDTLETTATPDYYIVYKKIDSLGYDSGTKVINTTYIDSLITKEHIYTYYVVAGNSGGISFPSEKLSIGISSVTEKKALIINGFNRLSGPSFFKTESMSGFGADDDYGVPFGQNISLTGKQHNNISKDEFITNDNPGWGSSSYEFAGTPQVGNTFDYTSVIGREFLRNGISFYSKSESSLKDSAIKTTNFDYLIVNYGKQKSTKYQKRAEDALLGKKYVIFTQPVRNIIEKSIVAGKKIIVNGSYIASDLVSSVGSRNDNDSSLVKWAEKNLKYKFSTKYASNNGDVYSCDKSLKMNLNFNTKDGENIYKVESPDGLEPINDGLALFRYKENRSGAIIGYIGAYSSVVMGFPFETILLTKDRSELMRYLIQFLGK